MIIYALNARRHEGHIELERDPGFARFRDFCVFRRSTSKEGPT
jgi:hypothetical protein